VEKNIKGKYMENYLGIEIDYNRDKTLPEKGLTMLTKKGFYKKSHETSPQQSFARAATCYCFGDYALAQRIYDAVSKGWFMYASPVLSNANEVHWPTFSSSQFNEASDWLVNNVIATALPISCYLQYIPDTKEGLVNSASEVRWLSMMGGGVGIYTSNRSPDDKSTGVMAHLRGYDADTLAYKQQESRRGSIAAYLDITHPEIKSFLSMRNPVGGDPNKKLFNLNNAVNLPDSFMQAVIDGTEYELVDPKHGKTGKTMSARDVWEEIIDMRFETGEPYIHWVDTVNSRLPKRITNPNYKVTQSNLCSEIELMTDASRTAVCCLSSLNLEKYEEWKDTTLVQDLIRFLDNVLEYFIRLAPKDKMARAIYSAKMERALGLGTFGWHSFLQSKNIPFESGGVNSAASWTHRLYSNILEKAETESKKMAIERGESPDCTGSGFRNSHLLAVA
jgi:ribonucleoside-diphosphate reductase alpha chain